MPAPIILPAQQKSPWATFGTQLLQQNMLLGLQNKYAKKAQAGKTALEQQQLQEQRQYDEKKTIDAENRRNAEWSRQKDEMELMELNAEGWRDSGLKGDIRKTSYFSSVQADAKSKGKVIKFRKGRDGKYYIKTEDLKKEPLMQWNTENTILNSDGDVVREGTKKDGKKDEVDNNLSLAYREYLSANGLEKSSESYENFQDLQIINKKALNKAPIERPHLEKLMADGYVPSVRITGPMLDAYEAMLRKASAQGKPMSSKDLYKYEFNAQKNRRTGMTAGGRIPLARKQNIIAARGLLEDMKVTVEKLDYSEAKFLGALEKFKKGQLNDPIFTEHMTQRSDMLFVLGNALKMNGLTDKSIEVEEEANSPVLSPRAFQGWYNSQVRALNRASSEMNEDFDYGMDVFPSFPAGQGGLPTPENPEPTMPSEQNAQSFSMGGENWNIPPELVEEFMKENPTAKRN